eukprot:10730438-Alexandrium_andersonii.AAC.1
MISGFRDEVIWVRSDLAFPRSGNGEARSGAAIRSIRIDGLRGPGPRDPWNARSIRRSFMPRSRLPNHAGLL